MNFWTWFNLEDQFDYVYISVLEDGSHWDVLNPKKCVENQMGFGCGFTGSSGDWIPIAIDLSRYGGKEIDLRFDYITDSASLEEGFLIDDISISAISYVSDLESDDGGWIAEGFALIENSLPQTYKLTIIYEGAETRVEEISVDANGIASFPLNITEDQKFAILVISATARVTQQQTYYSIRFGRQ